MSTRPLTQPTTGMTALRVIEVDPLADPRWEAFVGTHPDALVYHHPLFLQARSRAYGWKPVNLACEDADLRIRGILPLLRSGRLRTAHYRSTVPLLLDKQSTVTLLRAAVERAQREQQASLAVPLWPPQLDGSVEGVRAVPDRLRYVLDLPRRPEELRFGKSSNHTAIRRAVHKAARLGVHVRSAQTEDELRAWYELYLTTMRHHIAPPESYRFFQACWELLRPRGLMRLLLAQRQQGGHMTLLAGSLFLMFGQTVFFAHNGRRWEDLPLRPNDAIHWQAIHDACREGFRRYDFGSVLAHRPDGTGAGLVHYWDKWGAKAQPLHSYCYPVRRARDEQDVQRKEVFFDFRLRPTGGVVFDFRLRRGRTFLGRGSRSRQVANGVWRRLPLHAIALAGDWYFSYLY